MPERTIVLIIGVGRSGTSALTRVLSLCGASLPEEVLGAIDMNPRGCWEPLDALALNHRFMQAHGTEVLDPGPHFEKHCITQTDRERFVAEIRGVLAKCPQERISLIKEPAITDLMDFWLTAADREGISVKVVIPIRRPQEVHASLSAFFGKAMHVPIELTSAFWLKRNLLAERKSRGMPRVFVDYQNLLRNWRIEIARISGALAINLHADEASIDEFLSKDLYRHRSAGPVIEPFGQPWLGHVYQTLLTAAEDGPIDIATLDHIYDSYCASEHAFRIGHVAFRSFFKMIVEDPTLGTPIPILTKGRDF